MFAALLIIGLVTIYFLTRYFMRQIADLQQEIAAVRTEFETHLCTANADIVALTKSTETIAHNSALIEQIQRKLMPLSLPRLGLSKEIRLVSWRGLFAGLCGR